MALNKNVSFIVPLEYNDKSEIEPEKLHKINMEITQKFGGLTENLNQKGYWKDPETQRVYVDKTKTVTAFYSDNKDTEIKEIAKLIKKELKQKSVSVIKNNTMEFY